MPEGNVDSMRKDMSESTIESLMTQVPAGEARDFVHTQQAGRAERFFSVHGGGYDGRAAAIDWLNPPKFGDSPRTASYDFPAVLVTTVEQPKVVADGPASEMLDFYRYGGQVCFISARLCALIEEHDPGSLDETPTIIRATDAILRYYAVLPARSLYAIDVAATDVRVSDRNVSGHWFRSVNFPNGIVLKEQSNSVLSFSDKYTHHWYWSRELIELFRDAGMRGIYTRVASSEIGKKVDRI